MDELIRTVNTTEMEDEEEEVDEEVQVITDGDVELDVAAQKRRSSLTPSISDDIATLRRK